MLFGLRCRVRCDSVDGATVRELVGAALLRHVCQLVANAHAITGVQRTDVGPTDSTDHVNNEGGRTRTAVDVSHQVRLATAIYPTASLMNHSCDPSIISRYTTPTRLPYNLYCVGGDVKHCTVQSILLPCAV